MNNRTSRTNKCRNKDCNNTVFSWMDADYCCMRCRMNAGQRVSWYAWVNARLEERMDAYNSSNMMEYINGTYNNHP